MEDRSMSEAKNFFEQNMEMWEKWTGSYMDTMFKTVEKTMEQSSSFRKQIEDAVATAVSAQLEGTLKTMKALERQVETLSERVNELLKQDD
jgi:hypothetical protein